MGTKSSADREAKRLYWEAHLSRWEASGLGQSEYCRRNGLGLHRFIYWKKRRAQGNPPVALVEWPIPRQEEVFVSSPVPALCVMVGPRYRIEVCSGFDPGTLDTVVRVLRDL